MFLCVCNDSLGIYKYNNNSNRHSCMCIYVVLYIYVVYCQKKTKRNKTENSLQKLVKSIDSKKRFSHLSCQMATDHWSFSRLTILTY